MSTATVVNRQLVLNYIFKGVIFFIFFLCHFFFKFPFPPFHFTFWRNFLVLIASQETLVTNKNHSLQILVTCRWPRMGTDQSVCSGAWLPCGEAGAGWGRGQLAWGSPAPDRQSPAGMHWSQGHSVPWHGESWARPVRLEVGITFFPQHMRHREGKPPLSLEISKP